MPTGKIEDTLERLGVDITSNNMIIAKAILLASEESAKPVTFKMISDSIKKATKKKYTRAYIYRCLSSLEKDEIIAVDAIRHPRSYAISETTIEKSLQRKKKDILSNLLTKRQVLTTDLNLIESVMAEDVAATTYKKLAGIGTADESLVIEGIENVRGTIIREFAECAQKGDVIRVIAPASLFSGGLSQAGVAEQRIMARALDGVTAMGLIVPDDQMNDATDQIAKFVGPVGKIFIKMAETGNISLKLTRESLKTYRMVSLNSDRMLLYLTHAAESNMAALIHRKDNPGLIDDAIATFDRLFEDGIDVVGLVKQMLSSNSMA